MRYVRRFLRRDKDYFANNRADILRQNRTVMKFTCAIYMAALVLYTLAASLSGRPRTLFSTYYVFDIIHIVLCFLVFRNAASSRRDPQREHLYRIILVFTMSSFIILEAVFAYRGQHSIYFPFPVMLLAMLFVYSVRQAFLLIFSYVGVFVILTCLFKTGDARLNDIYLAIATLICSLAGYIVVANLRHETGEAMGRLRYLSMTDPLTGLYNKQTFESLCRAFIEDSSQRGYALLFIDIDRFKQINDRYGHQVGDNVLRSVSRVLRETFYDKDYICRFGGDEFVVFMADVDNKTNVNDRVAAFQEKVRALSDELHTDELSCSVGVALKAQHRETYTELLSRADAALYILKKSDGEQIGFAEQTGARDAAPVAAAPAPGDAADGESPPVRRQVLIVDDNAINRQVLYKILRLRYDPLEAENGQQALELLNAWHDSISAVLLDIVMPVMDGYEVLLRMREDPNLASIPVIVTTGNGEEEAEVKALSLGANDFIVKPYRPAIIMHRLENVIHLRESAAAMAAAHPAAEAADDKTA